MATWMILWCLTRRKVAPLVSIDDEYDVFLVQGYNDHHRWQVGKWCDASTQLKPNQSIRIFDDMGELIIDEAMNPGDILYIPACMAHYASG